MSRLPSIGLVRRPLNPFDIAQRALKKPSREPYAGPASRGFLFGCGGMAKYSPELIDQTIPVYANRTGKEISKEDARQAVDNISGFFQVLQELAEAEDKGKCTESLTDPDLDAKEAQ